MGVTVIGGDDFPSYRLRCSLFSPQTESRKQKQVLTFSPVKLDIVKVSKILYTHIHLVSYNPKNHPNHPDRQDTKTSNEPDHPALAAAKRAAF